jgi:hypothetical protein
MSYPRFKFRALGAVGCVAALAVRVFERRRQYQ